MLEGKLSYVGCLPARAGRLSTEENEKGEEVIIDKKRPSFKRFFDYVLVERSLSLALAYKQLRKMHGLSVKEVSARSGISEEEISKIETKNSGYHIFKNEATLKRIFKAIVNQPKGSRR